MPSAEAIDEALSQATDLAGNLVQEVGPAEGQPNPRESRADNADPALQAPPVEEQLDRIQEDINAAKVELAIGDPGATETPGAMDYKAAAAALGAALLTPAETEAANGSSDPLAPEAPEPLSAAPGHTGKPPGGKVIQLGKHNAGPTEQPEAGRPAEAARNSTAPPHAAATDGFLHAAGEADGAGDVHPPPLDTETPDSPTPAAHNLRSGVLNRMCSVLEFLDLPFRHLGDSARRCIGWIAFALLIPALVLLVISFAL